MLRLAPLCAQFFLATPTWEPQYTLLVYASVSSYTEKRYRRSESIDHTDKGKHHAWYFPVNFLKPKCVIYF